MITPTDIENTTIEVNGTKLSSMGVIVESFKVGAIDLNSKIYQGRQRTNFNVLSAVQTMRTIEVVLFFSETTRRALALKKSTVDNMMVGKLELKLPDGFYYSAYLESAGEEQMLGVEGEGLLALCAYKFKGIRHDPLETVNGKTVNCKSLVPRTDCRITVTASQDRASLLIDTVTITGVANGDVLVVDGINGRILQNGGLCAGNMSFIHFPYLIPGQNTIDCVEDNVVVEYYPTF